MEKESKIYIAGHKGLVGSAIVNNLKQKGYNNLVLRTHSELNLVCQDSVMKFFESETPEFVILAAAKVGGIMANSLKKARLRLMKSFSKEDQLAQGGDAYIFRLNLGTFGDFDTPANLFDEENVITVPISDKNTAYLAGLYYSLDEVIKYQKKMIKKGYSNSFIVAFKDGEKLEF